jgi:hypothetical protein
MGNTVSMNSVTSRFLALMSACGMTASILAYIASFSETHVDTILRWWIVLVPGWVAVFGPIFAREYPASRAPSFCWKGFARGMPSWAAPCAKLLSLIAIAQLGWYAVHCGWGDPEIRDGQFVLTARGQVFKALTHTEYLRLRGEGARVIAAMMINLYFVPLAYWWFMQVRRQDD